MCQVHPESQDSQEHRHHECEQYQHQAFLTGPSATWSLISLGYSAFVMAWRVIVIALGMIANAKGT
jgi:hypothetical protein